jgi:hypothetical protein
MTEAAADGEIGALLGTLDAQRRHVLGILEGLPDEALRRVVLPSGWTCLGLSRSTWKPGPTRGRSARRCRPRM